MAKRGSLREFQAHLATRLAGAGDKNAAGLLGVQAGAQAHGFLQVVDAAIAAVLHLADLQPEAVRAHVDGGKGARGQGAL